MNNYIGFIPDYDNTTRYIFALKDEIFHTIRYSDEIRSCILEESIWTKSVEPVQRFLGSNSTIGTQILQFISPKQMLACMDDMNKHIRVNI